MEQGGNGRSGRPSHFICQLHPWTGLSRIVFESDETDRRTEKSGGPQPWHWSQIYNTDNRSSTTLPQMG